MRELQLKTLNTACQDDNIVDQAILNFEVKGKHTVYFHV